MTVVVRALCFSNSSNTVQVLSVYMSVTYIAVKTVTKSLCAATIQEESQISKGVLYSVPSECYCNEVRYLKCLQRDFRVRYSEAHYILKGKQSF